MSSNSSAQDTTPFQWKTVLWFCIPALVIALFFRVLVMANMPYAFTISDTREFVGTSVDLASRGLNPFKETSRTFLAKVLYALPVFVNQPILPWVAGFQHAVGLLAVVVAGFLCRIWMTHWRWWIIPMTTLVAIHPSLLWYEHVALPDSIFIFCVLASGLMGGLYYNRPNRRTLTWFAVALMLTAAARQEGFLFLSFGVLVALSRHRYELKTQWRKVAVMVGILLLGYSTSKTSQGGQMLLTSTIHMAPDRLWFTPEFSEEAVRLRDQFKPRWTAYPDQHNSSRKIITTRVAEFLATQQGETDPKKVADKDNNKLCKRVGLEIALRNWYRLPRMAFNKFRATHREAPSPDFGDAWAHKKHVGIFFGKPGEKRPKDYAFLKVYYGQVFETREEALAAFERMYNVKGLDWLTRFQFAFIGSELAWRSPDIYVPMEGFTAKDLEVDAVVEEEIGGTSKIPLSRPTGNKAERRTLVDKAQYLPGLGAIYVIGFAGLVIAMCRTKSILSYRQLWILFLLFEAFAVFSTGSLRSRYRLIYEPWWFLGLFCMLDAIVAFCRGGWRVWFDGDAVELGAAPAQEPAKVKA